METARRNYIHVARLIVFALFIGLAGQVGAVCAQANLTGTWYANGVSGDSRTSGFDSYARCKIVINSLGSVVPVSSTCKGRDDVGVFYSSLSGGSVKVSSGCVITGYVMFGTLRYTIEFGQMEKGLNIFTFTFYQNTNPDVLGVFTAVKQ